MSGIVNDWATCKLNDGDHKYERERDADTESKRERGRAQSSLRYYQKQSRQHFHSLFASTRLTTRHTYKHTNIYIRKFVDMALWSYSKLAHRWTRHGHLIWFNQVNRTKIINKQQKKKVICVYLFWVMKCSPSIGMESIWILLITSRRNHKKYYKANTGITNRFVQCN